MLYKSQPQNRYSCKLVVANHIVDENTIDDEITFEQLDMFTDYEKLIKMREKAKEDKELEGMGTTLEVCLIYNNKAYIGHVGDSRVYRIRKNKS